MLFANRVDHDRAPPMNSLVRVYTVCYCLIKDTCNCVVACKQSGVCSGFTRFAIVLLKTPVIVLFANRVDHDQASLMRSLVGVYTVCYFSIKDTCHCVVANRVDHDQAHTMRSLVRVVLL